MVRRTVTQGSSKGVVELPNPTGEVFIAPGVGAEGTAKAQGYQAGIHARRGSLPKQDLPLNPDRPLVPHLSGGPTSGGRPQTMAEFAASERGQIPRGPAPAPGGNSIIMEGAPRPQAPPAAPPRLKLLPNDVLPTQAKDDPEYRQGYGSEFAANQPNLAAKYGVIRGGTFIPPQKLVADTGQAKLRPDTVAGLQALQQHLQQGNAPEPAPDAEDLAAEKAVAEGLGGSAARIGGVDPGSETKPRDSDDERAKALKRAIDQMDAFEFNQWRQLTMRQILHSEEERETIEKRLQPLDIGDILMKGVIRQRIPIIPGKYELTLQSYEGQVELALKRLVMMESRSVDVGEQYLLDKHSFMSIAVGLHKINDTVYPDVFDANGVFDDKLFFTKFNRVMRLPLHMLASIGVNLMWFEMRVRKLYSATALGNG
jgi:hypothetical protein